MDRETFKDIAPYTGKDVIDAVNRLHQYPQFLNNMTDILFHGNRFRNKWRTFHCKRLIPPLLEQVRSYDDFQKLITCGVFLTSIEGNSVDEFDFNGLENLDPQKAYLFISNHRDIVLDCALLDLALYRSGFPLMEMAIGDNLLANQFTTDMFKLNGAIVVKRSLNSASELRRETNRLSEYINKVISEENKSVWIAQKSGRSKDGIDNTSSAVVKMLYLYLRAQKCSFSEFLEKINIVPVSISYQYDPCDLSKSNEQIRKLKAEGVYNVYKKKKYQDILDLVRGLRKWKGNIQLNLGTPLSSDITNPRDAVREIDRQIHNNYKLWDTNYYCWDKVNNSERFADKYSKSMEKEFDKRFHNLIPEARDYALRSYANPVQSMLNEQEEQV